MRNLGVYPSCIACCVSEKTPEISACEAITVAIVASSTMGMIPHAGTRRKNGE